jgi:deazaflavin-dependent oxidoreductase (nitroreductase family)
MARTTRTSSRPPLFVRLGNLLTTALLRRGVPMRTNTLLTVVGRKSGVPRTTPVTILEVDGRRYIQSPFGETDWVRNLRAAGTATLTNGRHRQTVAAMEQSPEQAAPVLRHGLSIAPSMIRAHYDVTAASSLEEIAREAPRHPTFELVPAVAATEKTSA